ncbi:MAG: SusD/RagB family nutrient-binding outer membrane lipoprotein [Bacteroidetes bacterium]|nr:SusD/RagB family nutrient-binding outer membrane lipoprotein [Bacteroidota bacterium]
MLKKSYYHALFALVLLVLVGAGCKKGTFDINNTNPNLPLSVSPQFALSAALTNVANQTYNSGYPDFANRYMGYWSFSGDYGGYGTEATYNTNTSFAVQNWEQTYLTLENFKFIADASHDPNEAYYLAIAKIMQSFQFQRLVDLYNNIPYSDALNGGSTNYYPKYDDAKTVYAGIIKQLDSAITLIKGANAATADNPAKYDVMFAGKMSSWQAFANSLKLKVLLNLMKTADGPGLAQTELNGLTTSDFLGAGLDATVNPGYSNSAANQQNPMWQNVGFATNGTSPTTGNSYNRANSYAVNFYTNTNDPRLNRFYDVNSVGVVRGRAFGSQDGTEHNTVISPIGKGIINAPTQGSPLMPAFESLFLQAEARQRGYIGGLGADSLFKLAISESFRILGVTSPATAAAAYYNQNDARVNFAAAPDKINVILLQEWAALNMYDPIESWNNWRRMGIPTDLPVSIYPGTSATHVPYRLLYPLSEYSNNAANANAQGSISNMTNKIFWMP